MIAIGLTNASPIVAPPGGKIRTIGTNPIAFSVPDGEGGLAMQFDQSTSAVALGKIKMAKAAGESIPQGWAIDANGNPTTNPEEALKGSLVSSGGYKGWGFGLMAEILAAGMTGGTLSKDVKPLLVPEGPPHDLGQFYIIIDPSASNDFFTRIQTLADAIAQDEGARMPGRNKVDKPTCLYTQALFCHSSSPALGCRRALFSSPLVRRHLHCHLLQFFQDRLRLSPYRFLSKPRESPRSSDSFCMVVGWREQIS